MPVLKESATKRETAQTTITAPPSIEEFREQRRRKRKPTDEADNTANKSTTSNPGVSDPQLRSKPEVPTQNFFAPLRSIEMEADHGGDADTTTERQQHQAPSSQAGKPPPIVLTSQANLMQLRRQLKGLMKGNFEYRSTRNGTRVVTKETANFSDTRSHFEINNLPYFTFYLKSQKPINPVIRHLTLSTPTEDISDGLVNFGFDVISGKEMSTTR
jgi:hypothetical protein